MGSGSASSSLFIALALLLLFAPRVNAFGAGSRHPAHPSTAHLEYSLLT